MIIKFWKKYFGEALPLAHELKTKFTDRWVRFHSLPESKRYPDSGDELKEILFRLNKIIVDLSAGDADLCIVGIGYSNSKQPQGLSQSIKKFFNKPKYWLSIPIHNPEDEKKDHSYWHLYEEQIIWQEGRLDDIFRLVINDDIRNFMVINTNLGWVFHPYDGGVDIVFKNREEMEIIKNRYSNWLSSHPLGY